jgi:hypothetical protein
MYVNGNMRPVVENSRHLERWTKGSNGGDEFICDKLLELL